MRGKEEVRNGKADVDNVFREVAQAVAESPNYDGWEFHETDGEPYAQG